LAAAEEKRQSGSGSLTCGYCWPDYAAIFKLISLKINDGDLSI
jgi:hypothetical protein